VLNVVHYRFDREAEPARAEELSTATYVLLGLNYEDAFIKTLTSGVRKMRESSTYQAILREGRDEGIILGRITEAQRTLILQGTSKFGKPTVEQREKVEIETSREQLEIWLLSLLTAPDWDTLLG
jgi:predicted transposase YdaD